MPADNIELGDINAALAALKVSIQAIETAATDIDTDSDSVAAAAATVNRFKLTPNIKRKLALRALLTDAAANQASLETLLTNIGDAIDELDAISATVTALIV